MAATVKHRTGLPGKVIKALTLETLKPGYKCLRNGIGKAGYAVSNGCRDWRTSCDAVQTLVCNLRDM